MVKRICAWCQKVMGEVDARGPGDASHGICPECVKVLEAELREDDDGQATTTEDDRGGDVSVRKDRAAEVREAGM